jgi:hypothetical protein
MSVFCGRHTFLNTLVEIRFVQSKKHLTDGELLRFYRAIEPLYKL